MCESDPVKQKYLLQAFPDAPIFNNMADLGKHVAFDVRSCEMKTVPKVLWTYWTTVFFSECVLVFDIINMSDPRLLFNFVRQHESHVFLVISFDWEYHLLSTSQVDLVLIGYPCKSISPQNNDAKSFKDKKSVTGLGYDSLVKYVDSSAPEIVVAENVASLTHKRSRHDGEVPILIQEQAFTRRGYFCFHKKLTSAEFGLSQSRTRCWAIYIKKNGWLTLGPRYWLNIIFDKL